MISANGWRVIEKDVENVRDSEGVTEGNPQYVLFKTFLEAISNSIKFAELEEEKEKKHGIKSE